MDLAACDAAGPVDQTDHRQPSYRLAGAGLADHAQHFALGDVEGDAVDCPQYVMTGRKFDPQIAQREDRFAHRSFGLRASRSQSPSRLIDRIRTASAMPGKATIHHSPANR